MILWERGRLWVGNFFGESSLLAAESNLQSQTTQRSPPLFNEEHRQTTIANKPKVAKNSIENGPILYMCQYAELYYAQPY